jgi:hypothetical protein
MRSSMIAAVLFFFALNVLWGGARAQCPTPLADPPLDQMVPVQSEDGKYFHEIWYHLTAPHEGTFEMKTHHPAVFSTADQNPARWVTVEQDRLTNSGTWRIVGCHFYFTQVAGPFPGREQEKTNGHYIGKPRPSFGETTAVGNSR